MDFSTRSFHTPEHADSADVDTARRLKNRVLRADPIRPSRVILFGSRARGGARPDSDFDLLVLVPGITPEERLRYETVLYRALAGTGVVAQPFVMSEEEFEETKAVIGGLARPAWREGVVL